MNMIFSLRSVPLLALILFAFSCGTMRAVQAPRSSFDHEMLKLIDLGDSLDVMRVWKINNYQDSILLRTASTDIAIADLAIAKKLSARMLATVQDSLSAGVGIAAPQVGILKNMVIVQRFDKKDFPFETYVNPVIVNYSEEKQPCPEGCLSIPEKRGVTKNRAETIDIEYLTLEGQKVSETVSSFTAVVFQHEIDHLKGILFIDHLEAEN